MLTRAASSKKKQPNVLQQHRVPPVVVDVPRVVRQSRKKRTAKAIQPVVQQVEDDYAVVGQLAQLPSMKVLGGSSTVTARLQQLQQMHSQLSERHHALNNALAALKSAQVTQEQTQTALTTSDMSPSPSSKRLVLVRDAAKGTISLSRRASRQSEAAASTNTDLLALSHQAADAVRKWSEQRRIATSLHASLQADIQTYKANLKTFSYQGRWLLAHRQWGQTAQAALIPFHEGGDLAATAATKMAMNALPLVVNEVFVKSSASPSVVLFGSFPANHAQRANLLIEDRKAFEGISFKTSWLSDKDNALDVERMLIYHAFDNMSSRMQCPHIVTPLADIVCPSGVWDVGTKELQKVFNSEIKRSKIHANASSHSLVLDKCIPLMTLLIEASKGVTILLDSDFYAILWQVYYTLLCFEHVGIRHNDLALHNLLYKQLAAPEDIYYTIPTPNNPRGTMTVHIRTRFLVTLFDLDRGSIYYPFVERNMQLDNWACRDYGQCAGIENASDVAGFTLSMLQQLKALLPKQTSWFNFVCTRIFSVASWRQYKNTKFPQAFVHVAKHAWQTNPKTQTTPWNFASLGVRGSGLECLHALLTCPGVETVDFTKVTQYAFSKPYSLPERVQPILAYPKRAYLGSASLKEDVASSETLDGKGGSGGGGRMLIAPTSIDSISQLTLLRDNVMRKNERWGHIFNEWREEIRENGNKVDRWSWTTAAEALYVAYVKLRGKEWKASLQTYEALLSACMILACPMYYGLPALKRDAFRAVFIPAFDAKAQPTAAHQIKVAENMLWTAFGAELPILIPDLYNVHGA